ncbi:hypothetical protein TrVE_jg6882 [Triparma verrucosa]|uniref:UBC core domain-containing protein n=1 Tax=Triparma verrucosa TaxID=1606542 RepID=A0A9W7BJ82_9STRA|nr:hypothetical protein TrVE_jg6882 [Triparma verrucosa]
MSGSTPAIRRIKREYSTLHKDPSPPSTLGFVARPLESNYLHCHFLLFGTVFHSSPYEGGIYHGVLQFPKTYPNSPPSVLFRTESGRFQVNKKICFSMSDYHPELWNPIWALKTIIIGLTSFMNGDEMTTGGVKTTKEQRVRYARNSLSDVMENDALAVEIFGDFLVKFKEEREETWDGTSWPPTRILPTSGEEDDDSKLPAAPTPTATPTPPPPRSPSPLNSTSASEGSNKSKNKKKKEKEKLKRLHKKTTSDFLQLLNSSAPEFLSKIVSSLSTLNIDVSDKVSDHICYRTSSLSEYTLLTTSFASCPSQLTLLTSSSIGGRPISTYKLSKPLECSSHTIDLLELPSPKEGSPYPSGLEHVEFVIPSPCHSPCSSEFPHSETLKTFAENYQNVKWSYKATDKEVNPDVSVKFDWGGSCKFHLMDLESVIEWEIEHEDRVTWEDGVRDLILEGKDEVERKPYLVGLAGGAGSGKSTSAKILNSKIPKSMVLPADGYHVKLSDLKTQDLVYRRGAPDTFDVERFKNDLAALKNGGGGSFPGFDHAKGDPFEGEHVYKNEDVVIVEGLYLLSEEWDVKEMFDLTIFIDADIDKCMERLKIRNKVIPGYTEEEIIKRVDEVDRVNAETATAGKRFADHVVKSGAV